MPVIAPFKALRYGAPLASQMSKLVAPPYDAISPGEQEALHAAHPNNVVRLILAKDGAHADRYATAAQTLGSWLEKGVLVEDDTPALYVYAQRYTLPTGEELSREGCIAAVKLEPFAPPSPGTDLGHGVKAHERTLEPPLEDRLKVMMATQANLSQPFALYQDAEREIDTRLARHRGEPVLRFRTADGVTHALWRVLDAGAIAFVAGRLRDAALVIVDGQHRYEAALRYRDAMRQKHPNAGPDASFEYLPMFLCNAADPGLTVLPTHRLLAPGTELNPDKLIEGLSKHFFITQRLTPPATSHGARLLARELKAAGERGPCFAVTVPKMPTTLMCILKPGLDLSELPGLPAADSLRMLDVTVLHALCLEALLAQPAGRLEYEHDASVALDRVMSARNPAGFFLPATRIEQIFAAAKASERMPPKSTLFYPHLASGLILRRLDASTRVTPV